MTIMRNIVSNIAKLIDVKSIVTLVITSVFAVLSIEGKVSSDQFLTIFTVIISFFFGSKYGKQNTEDK